MTCIMAIETWNELQNGSGMATVEWMVVYNFENIIVVSVWPMIPTLTTDNTWLELCQEETEMVSNMLECTNILCCWTLFCGIVNENYFQVPPPARHIKVHECEDAGVLADGLDECHSWSTACQSQDIELKAIVDDIDFKTKPAGSVSNPRPTQTTTPGQKSLCSETTNQEIDTTKTYPDNHLLVLAPKKACLQNQLIQLLTQTQDLPRKNHLVLARSSSQKMSSSELTNPLLTQTQDLPRQPLPSSSEVFCQKSSSSEPTNLRNSTKTYPDNNLLVLATKKPCLHIQLIQEMDTTNSNPRPTQKTNHLVLARSSGQKMSSELSNPTLTQTQALPRQPHP